MEYVEIKCENVDLLHKRYVSEGRLGNFKFVDVYTELYYVDGNRHRDDGPAYIKYGYPIHDRKWDIRLEYYYRHGKLHCETGPAIKNIDSHENVIYEDYYINGIKAPKFPIAFLESELVTLDYVFEKYSAVINNNININSLSQTELIVLAKEIFSIEEKAKEDILCEILKFANNSKCS